MVRLDEAAVINTGLVTARKQARGVSDSIIQYKLLNLKAINSKGFIEDSFLDDFETLEEIKPIYITQMGDVVVRLTFPFTAVLIDEMHTGLIVPSHFVVIRTNTKKIIPEYLFWLLNTEKVRQQLQQNVNSTMIGTVKPMSYATLNIQQITLEEQRKIADIYLLSKTELMLIDQLLRQKELYYKTAIDKIQKEMRKNHENNKE
jgi:restriction endonuclease S subunit